MESLENGSFKQLPTAAQSRAKPKLRELEGCLQEWKHQRSAPFELNGRTFDMVQGSVALSSEVYRKLRQCMTGGVADVDKHLDKLDEHMEQLTVLAQLEQAFFGGLAQAHEGVNRCSRKPGTGWRNDESSPVKLDGVTYDRLDEERVIRLHRNRFLVMSPADRSFALYHVLRRCVLQGDSVKDADDIHKRADALAEHLARNEGSWPKSY